MFIGLERKMKTLGRFDNAERFSMLVSGLRRLLCYGALALAAVTIIPTRVASGFDHDGGAKPYRYFRVGSVADVSTRTKPGFALVGGGKDLDQAFLWMCERSGRGDFLVIRATGTDAYNPYIQSLCHENSVATLVIPNKQAAMDPFVAQTIRKAEAIFISGGDQANYINFWTGTPVQTALNEAIQRGVPVGGTSAGLAVQGEYIYSAQHDLPDGPDLTSRAALMNPFNRQVIIAHKFLRNPILADTITDTHFVKRDRLGRLLVFMARILGSGSVTTIRGIGIDEQTAVLLEPSGRAAVVGHGSVYFMESSTKPEQLNPGKPLTFTGVSVQKVTPGGHFDVRSWTGSSVRYQLDVNTGLGHSTQVGNLLY